MKMFKRLASVAIVVAMVLAMLPATVSAGALPEDVKGTKYENAASLLCALDIMVGDGTNFNPDNDVTRAEFAKIMVTAMGYLDTASAFAAQGKFTDVPTGEWYAPYVEFAAQLGAINGYGDGRFGPNDNVTGYQAIKMICFASGHNACIEDPIGGYPKEYVNVAKEYDFLENLADVNLSAPMTRGEVAVLTANVMEADMLRFVAASSESGKAYEVLKGVNLLSSRHDVYSFSGLVTATDKSGIYGPTNLGMGKVQIEKGSDVKVFDVGESGIDKKLGTYVKAFYRINDNDNTQTVMSFEESSTKNTKINTSLDNIDIADSTNSVIKYWADGDKDSKTSKIEIASDATVMWNGASSKYTLALDALRAAEGKQATVEFLDYDGNKQMDVVSIKAYETYVVASVDTRAYMITDELGNWETGKKQKKTVILDVEDENAHITISDLYGSEYELADIQKGDVLSVAISENEKVADVKLSLDTMEGTIDSIGKSNDEWIFEIGGEDYKLGKAYELYITKGKKGATIADMLVKVGQTYEFKIDAFGQIAYSEAVAGDVRGTFGFITKYAPANTADANINVRLFTGGSIVTYGMADAVKIDGDKYKGSEIIDAMDSIVGAYKPANKITNNTGYYEDGKWYGVPVLFELDADDKISYIDTPNLGKEEDRYTLQPTRNKSTGEIFESGYSESNAFGYTNPLSSSLEAIHLPDDKVDLSDEEKYSTTRSFDTSKKYYVQLFTTDPESYDANFMIVARGANGIAAANYTTDYYGGLEDASTVEGTGKDYNGIKYTPITMITDVLWAVTGEEEEETIIIKGYEYGVECEYTVDPKYLATGYILDTMKLCADACGVTLSDKRTDDCPFVEGDMVRLARNEDTDLVTHIAPVFLMEEKAYYTYTVGGHLGYNGTGYFSLDLATAISMDGEEGDMSYVYKNEGSPDTSILKNYTTFSIDADGRFVPPAENCDVVMTDTGYEGTHTQNFNLGAFSKIVIYDAKRAAGDRVKTGSLNDIITLEAANNKTNPSILMYAYRGTTTRHGLFILNF